MTVEQSDTLNAERFKAAAQADTIAADMTAVINGGASTSAAITTTVETDIMKATSAVRVAAFEAARGRAAASVVAMSADMAAPRVGTIGATCAAAIKANLRAATTAKVEPLALEYGHLKELVKSPGPKNVAIQ